MKTLLATVMMALLVLANGRASAQAGDANAAVPPPAAERPAHFKLVDAAPSIDVLIDRVLAALAARDVKALHRLRVTEDEYRSFILPGASEPGKPPQALGDGGSKFAWSLLDTNSKYAAASIIQKYGGRHYKVKEVEYLKGHTDYAWYDAYRTVSLMLEDEKGETGELVMGSIAHVDGQYKFVSLFGDP